MRSQSDEGRRSAPFARRPRGAEEFDAEAANRERAHVLRQNALRRQARARGLELRHSTYGYSLVDSTRTRVDGRNDLTLDDVETCLGAKAPEQRAKRSTRRV